MCACSVNMLALCADDNYMHACIHIALRATVCRLRSNMLPHGLGLLRLLILNVLLNLRAGWMRSDQVLGSDCRHMYMYV